MPRLCVLWVLCHLLIAAALPPTASAQSNKIPNNTAPIVGLLRASLEHDWITHDDLMRLFNSLSSDQPKFISPFELSNLNHQVVHAQLERLLAEGTVDHAPVKNWLADQLGQQYHQAQKRCADIDATRVIDTEMTFARVKRGRLKMPRFLLNPGQKIRYLDYDEEFEIMTTPFTQAMWVFWMNSIPFSHTTGNDSAWTVINGRHRQFNPRHPAENITYDQIMTLIKVLNAHDSENRYFLPSEHDWIYIYTNCGDEHNTVGWDEETPSEFMSKRAQAGKLNTAPGDGPAEDFLKYGWLSDNSQGTTHPVAQREPQYLDYPDMPGQPIWDMIGNVDEIVRCTGRTSHSSLIQLLGGHYNAFSTVLHRINPWDRLANGTAVYITDHADRLSWKREHAGFRLARQKRGTRRP